MRTNCELFNLASSNEHRIALFSAWAMPSFIIYIALNQQKDFCRVNALWYSSKYNLIDVTLFTYLCYNMKNRKQYGLYLHMLWLRYIPCVSVYRFASACLIFQWDSIIWCILVCFHHCRCFCPSLLDITPLLCISFVYSKFHMHIACKQSRVLALALLLTARSQVCSCRFMAFSHIA